MFLTSLKEPNKSILQYLYSKIAFTKNGYNRSRSIQRHYTIITFRSNLGNIVTQSVYFTVTVFIAVDANVQLMFYELK